MVTQIKTELQLSAIIGKRILTIRQIKGLSRGYLARKIGISAKEILKFETGKNTIDTLSLIKIAQILKFKTYILIPKNIEIKTN